MNQFSSCDMNDLDHANPNFILLKDMHVNVDDETIARYLISKQCNVQLAHQQLCRSLAWKTSNWPITKALFSSHMAPGKLYVHGNDKDDRPLLIGTSRLHTAKDRDLRELSLFVVWWMEQAISLIPSNRSKITILVDCSNHTGDTDIEFMKYFGKMFQA